jgi:plasmid stability protein
MDLPAGLRDALRVAAAEDDRSQRSAVCEALERWLKAREQRTGKRAAA